MKKSYIKLVATKLSQGTHERLKELAKEDRRTLSAMSRIIIEDYVEGSSIDQIESQE